MIGRTARSGNHRRGWKLLSMAALACHAPAPKAPATGAGADTTGVRLITERTDELLLRPELQQSPQEGAEAALLDYIESARRGTPNYEDMTPELAAAIRSQPAALRELAEQGPVKSIVFKGRGPRGGNLFDVSTEKGVLHFRIGLAPDGKIAALFFQPPAPAVAPSEPELMKQIDALLDQLAPADTFSGTVLLAKHGKPIFEAARGLADREGRIENRLETKFRIGSMNKMFTAVAVLQLAEAGKLGVHDPLAKHLPDYPNTELARSVTLHHLLTHTGGTGDIFGPDFVAHRARLHEHQDYIDLYGKRDLQFTPGARFAYSNYGFVLLGRVIEKASGLSYHDYVQQHVFEPAGMTASGSAPEAENVPLRAVGYHRPPGAGATVPLRPNVEFLPPRSTAAGGGYSTVHDLLRFANALLDRRLLSADSTKLLVTGKVDMGPGASYAYGFGRHEADGLRFFGHNGGAPGMNSDFKIFPDSGHVLVVMANLDPPASAVVAEFITARLPRARTPEPDVNTRAPHVADVTAPAGPAPAGPNLVHNGDFSAGIAPWAASLWPPFEEPRPMPARIEAGALCVSVKASENVIIGWPAREQGSHRVQLAEGARHRLAFRAWTKGPLALRLVAKVGHQDMPFTSAVQAPIPLGAEPELFAVDFVPDHADEKAGVAFVTSAPRGDGQNELCFDDVAISRDAAGGS